MDILGYSIVVDNGDGSSTTHFYKTKEAAQAHYDWVWKEIGYGAEDPEPVTMNDFQDEFEASW